MAFVMYCSNKGCGKETEPLLDLSSDEVFCSNCGKAIEAVTSFAKTSMKTLGQIKRAAKAQQAFSVVCANCKHQAQPKLESNLLVCPHCSRAHQNLAAPYVAVIKQYLLANPKTV